jgi:predicted deacetylase
VYHKFQFSVAWVVVCVHDVCPSQQEGVRWLLNALDDLGAFPRVLLVVPHEGWSAPLVDHPGLVRLLREECERGCEVVLHGYTHRVAGALRGDVLTRWRGRYFAPRDAEFASLPEAEMEARIQRGREVLASLGIPVQGFCPPGWLGARELPGVLRRLGFRYLLGMSILLEVQTGRRRFLPWFGHMGTGGTHEALVGLGCWVGLALARLGVPCVTAFFHPQDAPRSPSARIRLEQLARLLRGRRPTTYGAFLDV